MALSGAMAKPLPKDKRVQIEIILRGAKVATTAASGLITEGSSSSGGRPSLACNSCRPGMRSEAERSTLDARHTQVTKPLRKGYYLLFLLQ